MSKPPRKKIGLELSERDKGVINKTANQTVKPEATTKQNKTVPASAQPTKRPEHMLTANELRCYIPRKGQFAAELAAQLEGLDPAARRFISPSTVLTEFMQRHDGELAEMFRKSGLLK